MNWLLLMFIRCLLVATEAIGFVALSTLASTVCLLCHCVRWMLVLSLNWIVKAWKVLRSLEPKTWMSITTIAKNETDWIVVKFLHFSLLLGAKQNVSQPDQGATGENP